MEEKMKEKARTKKLGEVADGGGWWPTVVADPAVVAGRVVVEEDEWVER